MLCLGLFGSLGHFERFKIFFCRTLFPLVERKWRQHQKQLVFHHCPEIGVEIFYQKWFQRFRQPLRLLITDDQTEIKTGFQSHLHVTHAALAFQNDRRRQLARHYPATLPIPIERQLYAALTIFRQSRHSFTKTRKPLERNYPFKRCVLLCQLVWVDRSGQFDDRRFGHRRAILGARPASVKDLIDFLPGLSPGIGVFYDMSPKELPYPTDRT